MFTFFSFNCLNKYNKAISHWDCLHNHCIELYGWTVSVKDKAGYYSFPLMYFHKNIETNNSHSRTQLILWPFLSHSGRSLLIPTEDVNLLKQTSLIFFFFFKKRVKSFIRKSYIQTGDAFLWNHFQLWMNANLVLY